MIKRVDGIGGLPYGYGIGKVQPVSKTQMDIKKIGKNKMKKKELIYFNKSLL